MKTEADFIATFAGTPIDLAPSKLTFKEIEGTFAKPDAIPKSKPLTFTSTFKVNEDYFDTYTKPAFGFDKSALITKPIPLYPVHELKPAPVNETLDLLPMKLAILRIADGIGEIIVTTHVESSSPHINFGDKGTLTFILPIARCLQGKARARRIRSLVAWVLMHELNETLRYKDGSPVVDPHPEQTTHRAWVHPDLEKMRRVADRFDAKWERMTMAERHEASP